MNTQHPINYEIKDLDDSNSTSFPKKYFPFLIIGMVIIGLVSSLLYYLSNKPNLLLNTQKNNPVQQLISPTLKILSTVENNISKANEGLIMYYVKDHNLYGANVDGSKIIKLESDIEELDSVSPDGKIYLFRQYLQSDPVLRKMEKNPKVRTILKSISDKTLIIDALVVESHWSSDSHLVVIGTMANDYTNSNEKFQIVDTISFNSIEMKPLEQSSYMLAIMNNKHLLLRRNLSDSESTDQQNIEVYDFDPITDIKTSIAKINIQSPLGKLSFDNKMYSYSNTLNLEVLNLITKEKKEYTNYSSSNQNIVWSTSWSPSNTHIAFQDSGRIGILDLKNSNIDYISEDNIIPLYSENQKYGFRISDLNSEGWLNASKLFFKSEAVYSLIDLDHARTSDWVRSDKYWLYDLDSKQITPLSWIDNSRVLFINDPN